MHDLSLQAWWPKRLPSCIFTSGRKLHPPLYSHVVNFPRLELPLQGVYENQIEINGERRLVRVHPGQALFAPPNCWNLPVWKPGLELMSLLLGHKQIGVSIVSIGRLRPAQPATRKFSVPRPLDGPLPPIIEAMIAAAHYGPASAQVDIARALLACVRHLFEYPGQPAATSHSQSLLESVCVYLQNHYQQDVTRDSVARQFHITPNHLSRLFQKQGSMTFNNYLTHVRMDRAKHLLRDYNLKLDEIALRCGYREAPYFCHVFKRVVKSTPAEYRTKARQSAGQ